MQVNKRERTEAQLKAKKQATAKQTRELSIIEKKIKDKVNRVLEEYMISKFCNVVTYNFYVRIY